jgi:hypothetical protein
MAKRVVARPAWLEAPQVVDVLSVSGCLSASFADYVDHWRHNGYWLFDDPEGIREVAARAQVSLGECRLFFYEVHALEYDAEGAAWRAFRPEPSIPVRVVPPPSRQLVGYDVVTFAGASLPECSPLTCNGLAAELPVNRHGLAESFEDAVGWLEAGRFARCEPGPYRVFAVSEVRWPDGPR